MVLLQEMGHEPVDVGCNSTKSCDYPDMGYVGAKAVVDGQAEMAILLCGSGIGMSVAANKLKGIRAALCHDQLSAELSRRHNNANVLCLASDALGEELIRRIVTSWLTTEFESNGRHKRRVDKIACIEAGRDPRELEG